MKPTPRTRNAQPTSLRTTFYRSTRTAAIAAPLLAALLLSACGSENTTTETISSTQTSTTASDSLTTATSEPEAPSSSKKPQPTGAEESSAQDKSTAPGQSRNSGEFVGGAPSGEMKPTPNTTPADTQAGDYCGQVKTRDFTQPGEPVVDKKVYTVTAGTDCAAGLKALQRYADGIPYDAYEHGNAQIVKIPGGNCSSPTAASAQETNTSMTCKGGFGEVKIPQHG